jgi:hypothetical protein
MLVGTEKMGAAPRRLWARTALTTLHSLTLPITISNAPTGGLAVTGSAVTTMVAVGLGLVAIGAAAVAGVRRRPRFTRG